MGQIRKQAIISSIVIYLGFLVGFINTWLFTRQGSFLPEQYALTRLFFDVGQTIYAFSNLGIVAIIYKFYPYYKANLRKEENDLLGRALVTVLIGFVLVIAGGLIFEPLIVRKFSGRSPLFVEYYHWIFPFGFGLLMFTLLETFSGTLKKTILPNFLKETGLRTITLLLIAFYLFRLINFDLFIKLFAFLYLVIAALLGFLLYQSGELHLNFSTSHVTKKFKKKIIIMSAYLFSGQLIFVTAQVMDSIFIASLKGLALTGVFSLASYIANLIQVPQRSIVSITTPALSQAWKDKNLKEIDRIYKRTSINLLLAALFIFGGIWLNIEEAFRVMNIQHEYTAGLWVVFFMSLARIIDAGTGVSGQIIGTSTQWRFDFLTGVILLLLIIPLNYFFILKYSITGSAYANLIAFTVYNAVRYIFLWKKYRLQPFNHKNLLAICLGVAAYFTAFYLFKQTSGWTGILLKSFVFSAIFVTGIFVFKLTPDAMQLLEVARKRSGLQKD